MTSIPNKARPSTPIEFPFRLGSCPDRVDVADDIYLYRMDDVTRERLLHISAATYDEEGLLSSISRGGQNILQGFITEEINTRLAFAASNFVLVAPTRDRATDFNFALKLIGQSCSALYVGFQAENGTVVFSNPAYHCGNAMDLTPPSMVLLMELTALSKKRHSDARLSLMVDMYIHSLARNVRKESRFLQLAIILEMLLMPASSGEMSYKFSLRMAKIFQKLFGSDLSGTFVDAKNIYRARSKLVHAGNDGDLDGLAPKIEETVRKLLIAYLRNSANFSDKALESLVLGS